MKYQNYFENAIKICESLQIVWFFFDIRLQMILENIILGVMLTTFWSSSNKEKKLKLKNKIV